MTVVQLKPKLRCPVGSMAAHALYGLGEVVAAEGEMRELKIVTYEPTKFCEASDFAPGDLPEGVLPEEVICEEQISEDYYEVSVSELTEENPYLVLEGATKEAQVLSFEKFVKRDSVLV